MHPFAYVIAESPAADDDNNGVAPSLGQLAKTEVHIVDSVDDFGGNVSFLQSTSTFHEQDKVALVPVERRGGHGGELNVLYSTKDITAQASLNVSFGSERNKCSFNKQEIDFKRERGRVGKNLHQTDKITIVRATK